uniref:Uncharacterized protein n=1 Tax=Florenciella sp. virus SA2 TaxID=3240092 RepID=A0AB39JEC0_9VIRU
MTKVSKNIKRKSKKKSKINSKKKSKINSKKKTMKGGPASASRSPSSIAKEMKDLIILNPKNIIKKYDQPESLEGELMGTEDEKIAEGSLYAEEEDRGLQRPLTVSKNTESPELILGVFIAGYSGEEQKYLNNIEHWKTVFDRVLLFTDTRLDETENVWLKNGAIDLAEEKIPILDWYITTARPFLNDVRYITFYSDLCRWYIIKILNKMFPSDINGYTQASYVYVEEKEEEEKDEEEDAYAELKQQLKSEKLKLQLKIESINKFVIYGNDRNFMLDGKIKLRKSGRNFINRLCLSFDMSYEYLFKRGHFKHFNIFPVDRMIKASIENPDLDSEQVLKMWKEDLRTSYAEFGVTASENFKKMLKSDYISIQNQELQNFIEEIPYLFAGISFVRNIQNKIKIINPNQKFAPFFTRMEKGTKHWSKSI